MRSAIEDLIDNRDEHYAGEVGIGRTRSLAARVRDADLLLVIGERLGEMVTSGYTLLSVPNPAQALVHLHPGADELGKVYQPALAIAASLPAVCAALADMAPIAAPAWAGSAVEAHAEVPRLAVASADARRARPLAGRRISAQRLPEDAILVNGAGNYATGCIACTGIRATVPSSRRTAARWVTA